MRPFSDALVKATSELTKSLTAASASGIALQPEDLEAALVDELYLVQPLTRLLDLKPASARVHEIVRRTAHGKAAYEGASAVGTGVQSTYDRPTVTLKVAHFWGEVEGLQVAASAKFIDALLAEQQAGVEAMADQLEFGILWGNASADAYQIDGFDPLIVTNIQNVAAVVLLSHLDAMIDVATQFRGTDRDPLIFLASKGMVSKITGLQALARINITGIEFEGGLRMSSYRGYPLLETACVKPEAVSPAAFTATIATGGTLPNGAYYYRIAAVRPRGECVAAAEATCTSAATEHIANLAWTADAEALLYKVYRSGTTGTETLLTTIAAKTRDGTGLITGNVATWADTGAAVAPAGAANEKPLDAGDENIFLLNLNPDRGASLVGLINPLGTKVDNLIQYIQLATRKEAFEFMLSSFHALQVPWERLHVHARKVRVAT